MWMTDQRSFKKHPEKWPTLSFPRNNDLLVSSPHIPFHQKLRVWWPRKQKKTISFDKVIKRQQYIKVAFQVVKKILDKKASE